MPSPTEIAEAFSAHRFADAYPHLAAEVRWDNVDGPTLIGRDAVIAACEETLGYLATATSRFHSFTTVTGTDAVVIDVTAEYVGEDGASTLIASCDLFTFADTMIIAIRSYTVELSDQS